MNNDTQSVNYLQYMLYYDDMYTRRNEIENNKAQYRNSDLIRVFQDTHQYKKGAANQNVFFNTMIASHLRAVPT